MDLMTTREAATLLHASIWTIRGWIKAGRLAAYRREGRWLIKREDAAALIKAADVEKLREQRDEAT